MDEKKWATDQTTAAFVSIDVQPGLRYMQASQRDGGRRRRVKQCCQADIIPVAESPRLHG